MREGEKRSSHTKTRTGRRRFARLSGGVKHRFSTDLKVLSEGLSEGEFLVRARWPHG